MKTYTPAIAEHLSLLPYSGKMMGGGIYRRIQLVYNEKLGEHVKKLSLKHAYI